MTKERGQRLPREAADGIKRLRAGVRRQEDRDTTWEATAHAEGCYAWGPKHYECALAKIEALETEVVDQAVAMAQWNRDEELQRVMAANNKLMTENARLREALADAIRRPMGVIPDSAAGLVTQKELDDAEFRRARAALGGVMSALSREDVVAAWDDNAALLLSHPWRQKPLCPVRPRNDLPLVLPPDDSLDNYETTVRIISFHYNSDTGLISADGHIVAELRRQSYYEYRVQRLFTEEEVLEWVERPRPDLQNDPRGTRALGRGGDS